MYATTAFNQKYTRLLRSLILSFSIIVMATLANAQNFWENHYPTVSAFTVIETEDGGFMLNSSEGGNTTLHKLDYLGNAQWTKQLTGFHVSSHVKQTLDGGYIAVGQGDNGGTRCIAIAKLDATGNIIWGKTQELYNVFEARDVLQLADSSYIVAAAGGDNSGYDNSGLVKFDKNGTLLWSKSFRTCSQSGCHPTLNCLLDNGNGEFFAFGKYMHNTVSTPGWIIKFDTNGTVLTQGSIGASVTQATKTSDGNIVLVGQSSNDVSLAKINSTTFAGMWRKSYHIDLPFGTSANSWGQSVFETSTGDLVFYTVTNQNFTRCIVVKTDQFGVVSQYIGMAGMAVGGVGGGSYFDSRMSRTSDNGYIFAYGDGVKKIPENLSDACGQDGGITITTNSLTPSGFSVESPNVYTNNTYLGAVTSFPLSTPTYTQYCTAFVCTASESTDVQSACSSYTWIDGNTYTSSNNTATHTLVGGASNGCDSIITLNLTLDEIPPVPTSGSLTAINSACQITSLTAPTALDNCAGTITGTHNASLPISSNTTITWTYNDGNGNTSTQTQTVTINDNVAPVATSGTLTNLTDECSITTLTAPTALDNCAGTITGTPNVTLPLYASTTITWTYDDGAGNTSTQTQNVIINDVSAPVPVVGTLTNLIDQCSITSLTPPTANDNCSGTITGSPDVTLPITASTTITWTYDDGNGNTSSQTQGVVIADNTAPVANLSSLPDVISECTVTALIPPTALDNCNGTITGTPNVTLPITVQGSFTITWTYDDGNGNTSTQNQNIVIDDQTNPVVDNAILTSIVEECELNSLVAPTATDNCSGSLVGVPDVTFPITSSTTITWLYDDGNGNTASQTQNVTISGDVTAPVADVVSLADVTETCEVTSLVAPTATDNCMGSITGTHNATLPITTQGTSTITWTYDDGNGNTSTQYQDVIITDTSAPIPDLANLVDYSDQCPVSLATLGGEPTATDNCAGSITGTPNVTFPISASGLTVITWTFDDGNGNISTQTQEVTITPIDNGITQVDDITLSADAMATAYTYQWVDCNNGNSPIAGATNQTFTPSVAGSYACEISNGFCSVTTDCLTSSVGIIENSFGSNLIVYPNPTFGNLKIDLGKTYANTTVQLFDAAGRLIQFDKYVSTDVVQLNLTEAPGMYVLKIRTSNGEFAQVNVMKE